MPCVSNVPHGRHDDIIRYVSFTSSGFFVEMISTFGTRSVKKKNFLVYLIYICILDIGQGIQKCNNDLVVQNLS